MNTECGFLLIAACSCTGAGVAVPGCDAVTAQCICKFAFAGLECDRCQKGYYDYPNCNYCDCDRTGTVDSVCDETSGKCICKENYTGARCDQCADNYYSYPACLRELTVSDDILKYT